MLERLTAHRETIEGYLADFFDRKMSELSSGAVPVAGGFDADVLTRLKEYVLRGKLLRGALVFLGYEAVGGDPERRASCCLPAAAAMELTQSFLLIHDDIMDKDEVRRGVPSLHRQYRDYADARGVSDPEHLGVSLGICIGDVGVFLSLELLALAEAASAGSLTPGALLETYARELNLVGLAQMDDVFFGQAPEEPSVDRVVQVYRYKTGRYTFSLPLVLGAILAGGNGETQSALAGFGEELGVVFQIKDDQIGIFGEDDHIGKPAGSDIAANKKTVFRQLLISRGVPEETMALFGKEDLGREGVAMVREAMDSLGVLSAAGELSNLHRSRALEALEAVVGEGHPARTTFDELISFNDRRTR
jgi:geranylgeranyl diphosphate synthase, type I